MNVLDPFLCCNENCFFLHQKGMKSKSLWSKEEDKKNHMLRQSGLWTIPIETKNIDTAYSLVINIEGFIEKESRERGVNFSSK